MKRPEKIEKSVPCFNNCSGHANFFAHSSQSNYRNKLLLGFTYVFFFLLQMDLQCAEAPEGLRNQSVSICMAL